MMSDFLSPVALVPALPLAGAVLLSVSGGFLSKMLLTPARNAKLSVTAHVPERSK